MTVRRREIIFVEAYDPQGAEGYFRLFRSAWKRSLNVWQLTGNLGDLMIDSPDQAHWNVELAGPNWRTSTRYNFLRQERIIRGNMSQPMMRQLPRAFRWMLDDLFSGTLFRIFRASWQFGLVLIYFQTLLLLWLLIAASCGAVAALAVHPLLGAGEWIAGAAGLASALAGFVAVRPFFAKHHVIQINNHWPYLREFGRGVPNSLDISIEAGAKRLVEIARAKAVDELLIIGHSGGCVLAPAIVVRALEQEPELGRLGPRVVLMTLGSIMPAVALHPRAEKARQILRRLALEPSLKWIDCQSRKDVLNFWNFDPIKGVGIELSERRSNPLIWQVRFRDMVSPEAYRRLRFNFFRLHYQFIMGGERRASYDFVLLTCGPFFARDWAENPSRTFGLIAADGMLATQPTQAGEPQPAQEAANPP
ncbi:MAG TPA: hypothetical protein VFP60_02570 [Pseudolabrys sp.]|nr:hypothetical protein [Pseudolabrys sp.]